MQQLADEKQDLKHEIGRLEGEVARLQTLLHQVKHNRTKPIRTRHRDRTEPQVQLRLDESESLREEVNDAFAELKDGGTPRPDWQRCWRERNTAKKRDTGLCTGAAGWLRVGSRGGGKFARVEVATSW